MRSFTLFVVMNSFVPSSLRKKQINSLLREGC